MIVAITGDHPRHAYLVSQLMKAGILSGWVRERREAFIPSPPADLPPREADLFRRHFELREASEKRFFGAVEAPAVDTLDVAREDLNGSRVERFLYDRKPKVVISYGCHKLSRALREAVGCTFWNTHGGLSPDYRGVTTHFWPSYMLEPQMTGITLHETTDDLDGGAVIHQSAAPMVAGDGLHDLACRAVKQYADDLPPLLAGVLAGRIPAGIAQQSVGKLWHSTDWRPEHLHLIYTVHGDRIVDKVLNGEIVGREPRLLSVLR